MSLKFVLKRMRDEWRTLLVLLMAVCLMTGFFGLGPLYLRYANEVSLRYFLNNAADADDKLLIVGTTPFNADALDALDAGLGQMTEQIYSYQRSGYDELLSQVQTPCNFIADHCHQIFAFDDHIDDHLRLVEGRMPNPSRTEEESSELPTLEVAISDVVSAGSGLGIGDTYSFMAAFDEAFVEIVGIVSINSPNAFFWNGNRIFTTGAYIPREFREDRYDWGMMMHPASYEAWGWRLFPLTSYGLFLDLDTSVIRATTIPTILEQLEYTPLDVQVAQGSPVSVVNGLATLLDAQQVRLQRTEGPIIFLAALLLVIMLYNLVTTARLSLELQLNEYSILNARGAGWWQLVKLQFIPALILATVAGGAGVYLSKGLLWLITQYGPFAGSGTAFDIIRNIETPPNSLKLSAVAAFACVGVLVLPVLRPSQLNILSVKQSASRPITKPGWARLFLDYVLVGIGILLILRLYWIHGGDLSALFRNVGAIPTTLARQITRNLQGTDGLLDPFNIVAPMLILAGSALLWLRVFPMLMRGLSFGVKRIRSLGVPLAIWNVERNTTHYGQFVLMLISTLAIGTASLSLQQTQEAGAWEAARAETGGHAHIRFDLDLLENGLAWHSLTAVTDAVEFMHVPLRGNEVQTLQTLHVIGIDPSVAQSSFADLVQGVGDLADFPLAGVELPTDAVDMQVDVMSEAIATGQYPEALVGLRAYLYDTRGFGYDVELTQPMDLAFTPPQEWLTFSGEMPTTGHGPYHVWRVALETKQGERRSFEHTVYLDNWRTMNAAGMTTVWEGFDGANEWKPALSELPFIGAWQNPDPARDKIDGATAQIFSLTNGGENGLDDTVLKVDYQVEIPFNSSRSTTPSLAINTPLLEPLEVLISPDFAETFASAAGEIADANALPLEVDDVQYVSINLGQAGNLYVRIQVAGIHDGFPTLRDIANDLYIVMPLRSARLLINQYFILTAQIVDVNEAWLAFDTIEPPVSVRNELEGLTGVEDVTWAYIHYGEILREPVATTVAGIFFGGFWISLLLSLVNFTFYIFVTAKQRSFSFGVLRSIGWNLNHIWQLLLLEQAVLVLPAITIGTTLGMGLAYLLLPFMALPGGLRLRIPLTDIGNIIVVLTLGFLMLLVATSLWLRQLSITQLMRLGEE